MNTRERFIIYGALAILFVITLSHALDEPARSVFADPDLSQGALGPTDSLTLMEGDDKLVLRNRSGRLAWDDTDFASAHSVAFVHVGKAVGPLLEAEHYRDEYEQLQDEIREMDDEITQRLTEFMEENREVQPDDPNAEQLQRTYQELLQERERWRQEGTMRLGKLAAEQIESAYRDFVAAVEVVADRRGIDIVYRFIPTGEEFDSQSPPQAYTSIRARIAVKYPEALDITDEVLDELDVEVE